MADDVGWEAFRSYGGEDYDTPHLDRLAAKGVRFEHCYASPLCTPSRVMMMTGQYGFRNYSDFGYLDRSNRTFAHVLKDAGYKTAIAGKWQLNGIYSKKKHHDWNDNTRPFKAGFDEYALWQLTQGKGGKQGAGERFWSSPLEVNGKLVESSENHGQYTPDIMSDFVCNFIERNSDQPFFVYYPTLLVHDPFVATPETIGSASRGPEANRQPEEPQQVKQNFAAMVSYMDKLIGKILRKLEDEKLMENTLILFTADNGTDRQIESTWKGQQIPGGKGDMTDMGTRVPLIAYWQGKTATGLVVDDLVDFTDFYPTLAEAAGISLGKDDPRDGYSFMPKILGQTERSRKWVLGYYQPYWGRFKVGKFVRTAQYKLYGDGRYYDLSEDLFEANDLSSDPSIVRSTTYLELARILKEVPPVPGIREDEKGGSGRKLKNRPLYPDHQLPSIFELND